MRTTIGCLRCLMWTLTALFVCAYPEKTKNRLLKGIQEGPLTPPCTGSCDQDASHVTEGLNVMDKLEAQKIRHQASIGERKKQPKLEMTANGGQIRSQRSRRSILQRSFVRDPESVSDDLMFAIVPEAVVAAILDNDTPYYPHNRIPFSYYERDHSTGSRDRQAVPEKRQSSISAPSRDWCRMLGYTVCPRSSGR